MILSIIFLGTVLYLKYYRTIYMNAANILTYKSFCVYIYPIYILGIYILCIFWIHIYIYIYILMNMWERTAGNAQVDDKVEDE